MRRRNEDNGFASAIGKCCFFGIVLDGMGGENAGDVASALAQNIIISEAMKKLSCETEPDSARGILLSAITAANTAVNDKSLSAAEMRGMGTTVVSVFVNGNNAIFAHAGDSRAYILGKEGLRQVTHDHSMVQQLVDEGLITPEEAQNHPDKNLITRALGAQPFLDVEFSSETLEKGDIILLCSDGLTNMVSDEEITEIIRNNTPAQMAEKLVGRANENGGADNITVVTAEIEG